MGSGKVDDRLGRLPVRFACELCDAPADGSGICKGCRDDLPWIGAACRLCARPLPVAGDCDRCLRYPPPWSRAIAPLAWTFPVDALVSGFKYRGALHFGALLGRLLAEACRERRPDAIVPVPLHRLRMAERGFNQARELALPIARSSGVPLLDSVCERCVATPPQAGLSARDRRGRLRNAFRASEMVRGLEIAIVDDVLTTGSTAYALTRELLRAGASKVEVWAVARGGTAQAGTKV